MSDVISKKDFIKIYSKKILENKAAVFLGAGINVEVGLPTWTELLTDVFKDLNLEVKENTDLPLIAQFYINKKGSERDLLEILCKKINLKNKKPGKNLSTLVSLPIQQYWSTNYDDLLEKALNEENKNYDLIYNKTQFCNSYNKISVFKIHGDLINKENLVISRENYDLYEKYRKFFWYKLNMELISKNFLFVGTSMTDSNLNLILSKVNLLLEKEKDRSTHYIFFEKIKDNKKNEKTFLEHKIKDLSKRFNIKTILLDSYSELSEIFISINNAILKKRIFISGATYKYDDFDNEEESKIFLYNLANSLCKKNNKIITGFGLGVGNWIISGAIDYIKEVGKDLDESLDIWPFPQNSEKHDLNLVWSDYRNKIIDKAGIIIFVFGNKISSNNKNDIEISDGMIEEFHIAKKKQKIIIPIGSTGSAAEYILKIIEKDIKNFNYLKEYIDVLKFEKNSEKIINTILKIIEKID